jgi:hypothetical protein
VQTESDLVTIQLREDTEVASWQSASQGDVRPGASVTVVLKATSDGTAIAQRVVVGGIKSLPPACRGSEGDLPVTIASPSHASLLAGTVKSITAQTLTLTDQQGSTHHITLLSTTGYENISPAQVADVHPAQTIDVLGQPASDESIVAQVILIMRIPMFGANPM